MSSSILLLFIDTIRPKYIANPLGVFRGSGIFSNFWGLLDVNTLC